MVDNFEKDIVREVEDVRAWYFTVNVTTKAHRRWLVSFSLLTALSLLSGAESETNTFLVFALLDF